MVLPPQAIHPKSEAKLPAKTAIFEAVEVDTYAGKLHVEWDQDAAVTPIGQLPFFIQFLKLGGDLILGLQTVHLNIKAIMPLKKWTY